MSPKSATPGWLEIHALRCDGRHGAYAGEQDHTTQFLVDLAVRADLSEAIARDALDATIDIAAIAATTREIVGGRSRTLLERLASDVGTAMLERFPPVEEVRVRIVKREPDGLGASAEAAVITLTRSSRAAERGVPMRSATRGPRARPRARG